jgi:hypothetical protein
VGLGLVWVVEDGLVRPILVRVGHSDGINTEVLAILDGTLPEGTRVILG